jgi:hypothetical protein
MLDESRNLIGTYTSEKGKYRNTNYADLTKPCRPLQRLVYKNLPSQNIMNTSRKLWASFTRQEAKAPSITSTPDNQFGQC